MPSLHSLVTLSNTTASSEISKFKNCNCNEHLLLKYNKPILLMDKYHIVDQTSKILILLLLCFITIALILIITQHSVIPTYSALYKQPYERWNNLLKLTNKSKN